jgi:hypothetical protein
LANRAKGNQIRTIGRRQRRIGPYYGFGGGTERMGDG